VRASFARRLPVLAGALAGAVLVGGAALALTDRGTGEEIPTITLTAHHSRFTPARISVEPGTLVRFVIRNEDPIPHEFIIGPQEVHDRHEKGTEMKHGAIPGEVSVDANTVAETTYLFGEPGSVQYGCHLPGHWNYGMHGVAIAG
jgi:uncharacterized cupredoxin-like copper-binding protein